MSDEKTEQPTPRKLRKARDKGQVHKSTDVTQTVVFIALIGTAALGLSYWLPLLDAQLSAWPVRISRLAGLDQAGAWQLLLAAVESLRDVLLLPLAVVFGVAASAGLLAVGLQVRGIFSGDPLIPKGERLNPGANLKRVFSTRNLFDLSKILIKVVVVGTVTFVALRAALPDWIAFMRHGSSPSQPGVLLARTLLAVAMSCVAVYVVVAAADYGHQYFEFMKEQRMSKDEVRREHKEIEGDPYVKGYRRAMQRMMASEAPDGALKGAKLVVTNPTHYAVALAYDATTGGLPHVVAKGVDRAALALRQQAQRLGIAVVEERALARKLYASVPEGQFITSETMADVARLLARAPSLAPTSGSVEVGRMGRP